MPPTGYSGTPLARKLGMKEGFKIRVCNQPEYYFELFSDLPDHMEIIDDPNDKKNFIHYFVKEAHNLQRDIDLLKNEIKPDGILWISWPKRSSNVITDVSENLIRKIALNSGFVDTKICAVDDVWSGLKFVIPVRNRKNVVK